MRPLIDFNSGWLFEGKDTVRLPHTAVELPFSYFDEKAYQRAFTYEKTFTADPAWRGREVSVVFDGAMANAKVSLNGTELAAHKDGYTPFEARLTGLLKDGENRLTVTIDGSENPEIPPFGGQIDYLTYAGIYREAWLRVTGPIRVGNGKIETPDVLAEKKSVRARIDLANPQDLPLSGTLLATLKDAGGKPIATTDAAVTGASIDIAMDGLAGIQLWDIDNPALYTIHVTIDTPHGQDEASFRFGFRSAEFTTEGFKFNGKALKLRGLNRHQSFPYIGYALGKSAQVRDAEILKRELKLNMVRTSHYPQSHYFLDRCDELGLLVFEEIPGWQHIGGEGWKDESVENVRRMITRDWNHPAIVIWGVRINESQDDRDFYLRTNKLAHELDSTRPTGGVRYITDSELLEDVYTMNDFERCGNRVGDELDRLDGLAVDIAGDGRIFPAHAPEAQFLIGQVLAPDDDRGMGQMRELFAIRREPLGSILAISQFDHIAIGKDHQRQHAANIALAAGPEGHGLEHHFIGGLALADIGPGGELGLAEHVHDTVVAEPVT